MKIPVTIITGFLGAGKTTLLRHLLAHAQGRRLALIINEFGEQGIDRDLLLGCGDATCEPGDIVELANGCLCCKVADDFLPTIEALLARPNRPDHIVVETSGLALPKPLVKALAWPEVRARLTVDGVIAVIDGPAVAAGRFADDAALGVTPAPDHDNPLAEVFEDQLACADLVILNKRDALADADAPGVTATLAEHMRAGVRVVEAKFGAVDARIALGLHAGAESDLATRPSHIDAAGDHDHDDFESFALDLPAIAEPESFARLLAKTLVAHDVLRVKGFIDVPGKQRRLALQAVGPRIEHYFDRPWSVDERRASRLVVIGRTGLDRDAITRALVSG